MLKSRISAARECLSRCGVEALVVTHLPLVRYLTGFTGSDGAVVISATGQWFLTDSRYTTQAAEEAAGFTQVEYRGKLEGITSLLRQLPAGRVGFEAEQVTVAFHRGLADALPAVELVPLGAELDGLRMVKDAAEIRLLERSAELASTALLGILDRIRPGVSERELALELEFAMKRAGAEEKSFDFIVASGERGALPHGRASAKEIRSGELVTIDFGSVCQGYHSDETVTVAVCQPAERQREVYRIVREAHDRAIDAVRPGVILKELDAVARDFITQEGYGAYFGHGLGHGVGLEVHEKPTVSFRGEEALVEGMVFTIEPGIYIPGWGGVRIEDTVVVTGDGCRLLTRVPKDLLVL